MNTSIRLRALEPEDLDLLYAIENDTEVWDAGENNVPYSRYILHDYIAHAQADIYADQQVRMAIVTQQGITVGLADVVNFSPSHRRAEVSIIVQKQYRRNGYALQALKLVKTYALHTLHLHQLYAVVSQSNKASASLFTKAGFKAQAQLEDWLFDGHAYRSATLFQCFL